MQMTCQPRNLQQFWPTLRESSSVQQRDTWTQVRSCQPAGCVVKNWATAATTNSCMPWLCAASSTVTVSHPAHFCEESDGCCALCAEVYATIRHHLPGVQYHGGALMLLYSDPNTDLPKVEKLPGHVAIVCGSGADVHMAYEAKVALALQGGYSTMMRDVSPTKLSDLISRKEQLQAADAVIVCCGEQPSLAGLILSLVDVPVIAIPGKGSRPDPNLAVSIQGAYLLLLSAF